VSALRRLAAVLGAAWTRFRARGTEPYESDAEFIASVAHLLPPAALADPPSACPDCGGLRTDLAPDGTGHRIAQCGRCGGIFDLTAAARPEWLYGSGCCDQWTPEDGCRWHTGRPAMSLAARELGREAEADDMAPPCGNCGSRIRYSCCAGCPGRIEPTAAALDPSAVLDRLGAIWSDDFDAYASGELDASKLHCALCQCAPCRCPEFGTPAYFALVDFRHGRGKGTGAR
jgi:hypothetical protein